MWSWDIKDKDMAERFKVVLFDLGSTLIYFDGSMPEVVMRGNERLAEALVNQGYPLDKNFVTTLSLYNKSEARLIMLKLISK